MNTDKQITDGRKVSQRGGLPRVSAFICVYLWLISLPAQAAEPLGRLFLTPEQRVKLETARSS